MRKRIIILILAWLRFWARLQLKKIQPEIIGITGSAGKTTTRNAVAAVLKDSQTIKVSYKANSESGIPLNILNISPHDFSPLDWLRMMILAPIKILTDWQRYDTYVVEMGIDSPTPPKNMEYLLTIIKPDIGIFLNALPVHTAFFGKGGVEAIAAEKGKLIKTLPAEGLAVINGDDPLTFQFGDKTRARVMTFGRNPKNKVRCESWKVGSGKTSFTYTSGDDTGELSLPYLLPEHYADSFGAALCVSISRGKQLSESITLLETHFILPPGRATLLKGIHESILIDSSYNASPAPTLDMLDLLDKVPAKRKLCLLGDMRELGEEADDMHEKVVARAMAVSDEVHLVGPLMRKNMMAGAFWHQQAVKAAEVLKETLKKGDVLLVKGSQNEIFLEAAVEQLLADPADVKKLCRRGEFWERKRDI
jgi:UDP-N-acetylmuramyl pentapeptide synthase